MIEWQDGTLVSPAQVNEDGTITPSVYSGTTPLTAYNLNKMQDDLNGYSGIVKITATTSIITLPTYYKVGANVLEVYGNGEKMIKASNLSGADGHYVEVGEEGSLSNKIQCTNDMEFIQGDVLEFIVKGVYENEET